MISSEEVETGPELACPQVPTTLSANAVRCFFNRVKGEVLVNEDTVTLVTRGKTTSVARSGEVSFDPGAFCLNFEVLIDSQALENQLILAVKQEERTLLNVYFFQNQIKVLKSSVECYLSTYRKVRIVSYKGSLFLFVDEHLVLKTEFLLPPVYQKKQHLALESMGDKAADCSAYVREIVVAPVTEKEFQDLDLSEEKIVAYLKNYASKKGADFIVQSARLYGLKNVPELQDILDRILEDEFKKKGLRDWFVKDIVELCPALAEKAGRLAKEKKVIVDVKEVSSTFFKYPNLRLSLSHILRGSRQRTAKFSVLDQVSFQVYEGDILGIIGPNGAGKSTLLKTLAGLISIEKGEIEIFGSHLLLSPGMGINEALTGRENIRLVCCYIGVDQSQIPGIEESVIAFSELGDNIDRSFRFYSDGMKSRLIFSIATSIAPDILMLDELLSAGDVSFQEKAQRRMDELIQTTGSVLVVTHSLKFVTDFCNKALLVVNGKVLSFGSPKVAVAKYLEILHMNPQYDGNLMGENSYIHHIY